MAISSNYITLQRQIADELGDRTDLLAALSDSSLSLSPVKNAIQSAIAKWEGEPFYFNEVYTATLFTTVASQEFYTSADAAAIATMPSVTHLGITVSGSRYPLTKRTWQYLSDISMSATNSGQPGDWSYFAERIRLYPIPNGAYVVTASRLQVLTALSADADANVWTQDGFDLIRSEAKLILAQEVLHDDELAGRMKMAIYGDPGDSRIRGYFSALKSQGMRRAKSRIRPSYF